MDNVPELIEGIRIPPVPEILSRLHGELQKDDPEMAQIATIIAQDVGMAGLVLKTVNAPFFGLQAKVQTIQNAVSILGMNYTVAIVAGLALKHSFEQTEGEKPPRFWDSPSNIAVVAAAISKKLRLCKPDEMYTLGLFHNVGHALMTQKFDDYLPFLEAHLNLDGVIIADAENQQYQCDHGVVGYYLAVSWGLDRVLAQVIRDHHSTADMLHSEGQKVTDQKNALAVLKLAEHVDKRFWGMTPDAEWQLVGDQVLDYLGLSSVDYEDICDEMQDLLIS